MNCKKMKTARSFILLACAAAVAGAEPVAEKAAAPPAMAWIPGGTFLMGSARYSQAGRQRSCAWSAGIYSNLWTSPAQ